MPIKDKYRLKPASLEKPLAEDGPSPQNNFARFNTEIGQSTWIKPPETKNKLRESTTDGPQRKLSFRYKSTMEVGDPTKHILSSPRTIVDPVTPNRKNLKRSESRKDQKSFYL
jgi:hypothetical protein